ncbi:hypothetical protein [Antrihabitans cavernicola]|uniref:hypothetical protein n=1 Tax=Antrihabitans cavernicola TaxID=2495913 RepID=UPI001F256CB3|nr:hypothetical protein [Spelaeibacter cavernicola]
MTSSIKWVVLALLIFDGLLTVALEVLFLPTYIGSWPFPLSAVVAALVNVLLVVGARTVTDRTGEASLPLVAWGLGFMVALFGGPGGDVMLLASWPTILLLVLGVAPAGWVLFTGALNRIGAA